MDETTPEVADAAADELKIDATLIAKLNLADFQNAVPLIRDLWLINETDKSHEHVELILTSEPPFLKPRRWRIDALQAGSRFPIRDLDLNLDGGLLARLTEAETATVSPALRCAGNRRYTDRLCSFLTGDANRDLLPEQAFHRTRKRRRSW